MAGKTASRIAFGTVMHRRHHPVQNRFVYPVFFVLINMNEIESRRSWLFGVNQKRPVSIDFKDHGDGTDPNIWVRNLLHQNDITDAEGAIWLQTFPRVLGFLFNPVSFWYCTGLDRTVRAIIAEVNNTFGERHCYILQPNSDGQFKEIAANKKLYVSPFYKVKGGYKFNFTTDFDKPHVQIDYYDEDELQLNTSIQGKAVPLTITNLLRALLRQPFLTFGVVAKIHWQALRLWLKKIPLVEKTSESVKETQT